MVVIKFGDGTDVSQESALNKWRGLVAAEQDARYLLNGHPDDSARLRGSILVPITARSDRYGLEKKRGNGLLDDI